MIRTGEYYPLGEGNGLDRKLYRVRATGEYRLPRAGEWFLSGAVVEGYRAIVDFEDGHYHIGELVKGEVVSYWRPAQES